MEEKAKWMTWNTHNNMTKVDQQQYLSWVEMAQLVLPSDLEDAGVLVPSINF